MKQISIKNLFKIPLFTCVFLMGLAFVQLQGHTNHTYLLSRPEVANLPYWSTTTDELVLSAQKQHFGGTFQVVPSYQESFDNYKIAKYFLLKEKSSIHLNYSDASNPNQTKKGTMNDYDALYSYHYGRNANPGVCDAFNAANVTIALKPTQKIYNLGLAYHQNLKAICKNLYFYVNMPIVHIERNTNYKLTGGTPNPAIDPNPVPFLQKFFTGDYEDLVTRHQYGLANAKFSGKQIATGIADIDAALGYTFIDKEYHQASVAIGMIIPTSNKAKAEYVFEPIFGNGDHLGLGVDLEGWRRLCKYNEHALKIKVAMKIRYLFEGTEKRTLGIKGREWGQYYLLGQVGVNDLVPAANILTRNVSITPGVYFDGIAALGYTWKGFCLDLGYDLYARERDAVRLNETIPTDTYAICARGYAPGAAYVLSGNSVDGGVVADALVNNDSVDTSVAATPAQVTNSIYGSVGYIIGEDSSTPVMFSLGGKGEWADKNSAISQWQIWGKVGVGF